jgi:serine/threonine-protein kinase
VSYSASVEPVLFENSAKIQSQLRKIISSGGFRSSPSLQRFLIAAVERTLAGQSDQLKEYSVGRDIFNRGVDFDPRVDSIVRVEAQRLRRKLREYYEGDGQRDTVLITLPTGGYTPVFGHREVVPVVSQPGETVSVAQAIAVLPFVNLSADPNQDLLCDGLTEEIINRLSSIPELKVVGRTTMYAFKGATDLRKIGAALQAGMIVEGSVRKAGRKIRVSANAIDAKSGCSVWARNLDFRISAPLAVQEAIADEIVRALPLSLRSERSGGASWPASRRGPSMRAYLEYLRGRGDWYRMTVSGARAAAVAFESATALSPGWAEPYAGLADAFVCLGLWGALPPREAFTKSSENALRALDLDPGLASAHTALGFSRIVHNREWREGTALLSRALELEPSFGYGHHMHGVRLLMDGNAGQALPAFRKALELDPLAPWAHRGVGWACYAQRRLHEAETFFAGSIAIDSRSTESRVFLGRLYLYQNRLAEARDAIGAGWAEKVPLALALLGAVEARSGNLQKCQEILGRLEKLALTSWVDPICAIWIHYELGHLSEILDLMRAGIQARAPGVLITIPSDPQMDSLRAHPRFEELLAEIKSPAPA